MEYNERLCSVFTMSMKTSCSHYSCVTFCSIHVEAIVTCQRNETEVSMKTLVAVLLAEIHLGLFQSISFARFKLILVILVW